MFANFVLGRDHASWYLRNVAWRPDTAAVNQLLVAVAHCAADVEAAIARLLGAQIQLLLAGIHTGIDPHELRSRLTARDLSPPDRRAASLAGRERAPIARFHAQLGKQSRENALNYA